MFGRKRNRISSEMVYQRILEVRHLGISTFFNIEGVRKNIEKRFDKVIAEYKKGNPGFVEYEMRCLYEDIGFFPYLMGWKDYIGTLNHEELEQFEDNVDEYRYQAKQAWKLCRNYEEQEENYNLS